MPCIDLLIELQAAVNHDSETLDRSWRFDNYIGDSNIPVPQTTYWSHTCITDLIPVPHNIPVPQTSDSTLSTASSCKLYDRYLWVEWQPLVYTVYNYSGTQFPRQQTLAARRPSIYTKMYNWVSSAYWWCRGLAKSLCAWQRRNEQQEQRSEQDSAVRAG